MNIDQLARHSRVGELLFAPQEQAITSLDTREAFGEFYQANLETVYRYHLAHTGNVQDAQDLAAETFQAALEARRSYHSLKGSQKTWVMGIAHHKLVDYFRRSYRNPTVELAELQSDFEPLPEEITARRLQEAQISQALKRLPPDRAEAVVLHYFAGLNLAETSLAMGKSQVAVKKLIQRGLQDLRRWLAPERR